VSFSPTVLLLLAFLSFSSLLCFLRFFLSLPSSFFYPLYSTVLSSCDDEKCCFSPSSERRNVPEGCPAPPRLNSFSASTARWTFGIQFTRSFFKRRTPIHIITYPHYRTNSHRHRREQSQQIRGTVSEPIMEGFPTKKKCLARPSTSSSLYRAYSLPSLAPPITIRPYLEPSAVSKSK
jgi:hypothetical protein